VRFWRRRDRLFNLCSLLDFFRAYNGKLNWRVVENLSKSNGVEDQVQRSLETLAQFSEKSLGRALPRSAKLACRMLEHARYDEQTGRYGAFKRLFLLVFTLLSVPGAWSKCNYAARLICNEFYSGTIWTALKSALAGLTRRTQKAPSPTRAFAYWIESSPAGEPAEERQQDTIASSHATTAEAFPAR